jgi:hypothetical protein
MINAFRVLEINYYKQMYRIIRNFFSMYPSMSTIHSFINKIIVSFIVFFKKSYITCHIIIMQVLLKVHTHTSMYKKHTTTTVKSSFFGLFEGFTVTGAVVIGLGGLVVYSVYALYTGESTL